MKKFSTSRLAEFELWSPNTKEAGLELLPAAVISSCPIENRERGATASLPCAPSVKGAACVAELSLTRGNEQKASAV